MALSSRAVSEVRAALQGVSEWFDQYIAQEETIPGEVRRPVLCSLSCWFTEGVTDMRYAGRCTGARAEQDHGAAAGAVLALHAGPGAALLVTGATVLGAALVFARNPQMSEG